MLLQEGMNLKVLLLPDSEDPDSFARKHSSDEFKDYIESHATDFIRFKTALLLDNENDPLKRSEAHQLYCNEHLNGAESYPA